MSESTQVLATLAGAIIGGAIAVVSGFLIQRQLFKRESTREMRDRVYGPMFLETTRMFGEVKSHNSYSLMNLDKVINDYLFFTIGQGLKSGLLEILGRFNKLETVRHAAELVLDDFVRQEVKQAFRVTISGSSSGADYVWLRLLVGKPMASSLNLKRAIFLKLAPRDFIKEEKESWGENVQIESSICGIEGKLEEFESMYKSMLAKMEKEPLYLAEREQRIRLIEELRKLIEQIKPFVKSN